MKFSLYRAPYTNETTDYSAILIVRYIPTEEWNKFQPSACATN